MSHTFEGNAGTIFNYNSDLSGLIHIESPEEAVDIPASDLLEFLIEQISNIEFDVSWLSETMQNAGLVKIEVHNDSILTTRVAK